MARNLHLSWSCYEPRFSISGTEPRSSSMDSWSGNGRNVCPKRSPSIAHPETHVEIDLDGITCVDRAGEKALLSLWQAHGRFLCTFPFPRALCERLGISVERELPMTPDSQAERHHPLAATHHDGSFAEGPWLITIAVMLSTFMEVLDSTVVNVSLTHIAGSLSSTTSEATWVLTSYLVANGVVIPISGWLANHFGRKNLLFVSTVGFTVASLLCGIAPTMGLLVTFRVIQGACGGSLQPLSQAVLLEAFPPKQHGKAMAIWALGVIVAPVLGPVMGGWLTDNFSWRWVFYINLPVGVISVLMIKAFVKDPPYIRRSSAPVDSWGLATLVIWVAGAPDHAGQRAGSGLVRLPIHRVPGGDVCGSAHLLGGARVDGTRSGCRPARVRTDVFCGCHPGQRGPGLCDVREPGDDFPLAANSAGLSLAASRGRHGRHGIGRDHLHAAGFHS